MKCALLFSFVLSLPAQEHAMTEAIASLKTDDRLAVYQALAAAKPADTHYQMQMAGTYLQKMRETTDPEYLNRASKLVEADLAADGSSYEALRLKSAIEL